jgi:DNA polymerase
MTSKPIAHTTINRVEINVNTLEELNLLMKKCDKCVLGATRQSVVCGEGNPNADIMVIGEAPGADEDEQGLPFVGRAGKLLTDILKAVNFSREDVFIANICKCRPPANRKPTPLEVHCCEPYLIKQIELIKPKFILALGLTAAEALFKNNPRMLDIRGQILDYYGIKTMVTYHPAALLRNPNWKRPVWEDVQLLRQMYDEEMKQSRTS